MYRISGHHTMKITIYVFLGLLLGFAESEQEPYECHGDVCNAFSDMEPQFCSSVYKMCRDCKDIKQDCHTSKQPLNCSEYCKDLAIEEAFKIKKMEEEKTCFVTSSMVYLANGEVIAPEYNDSRVPVGSVLQHRCNNGYTLEGPVTQKCLGNDTWSEVETPYCFDNSRIDMAIEKAFKIKTMAEEKTCFVQKIMVQLTNGKVIAPKYNDSRVHVGTTFRHRCNDGYTLEGPVTQKCLGNDTWSEIETPYCFDNTWLSFKSAAIALGIFSTWCLLTTFLFAIKLYLLWRKGKQISKAISDDSFHEHIGLLSNTPEDQTTHTEDEQTSFTPRRKTNDDEKSTESPITSSTRPSAPPAVEEPQHENKMGQQNNINNSTPVHNQTGQPAVYVQVINNVIGNSSPGADGKPAEKPMENATSANQTRQRNKKGIDVKMSREESNETDATEESDETEAVKETVSDAKNRGTKPLPVRGQKTAGAQEEMSKGNEAMGPQAVPAKDENIQSPAKETGQDCHPGKLGFNDATFQSTDAERSEMHADVAEYPNEVGSTQRLDELKEGIGTNVQTTA